jgi:hypothetical membrane protein
MGAQAKNKLEVYFGFFGILFSATLLIITAILTPNYTPLKHAVSSLGERELKFLFSISLVIGGSSCIPFYMYLERELINVKENVRRLATGVSIFSCVCIALVGIIPDETFWDFFILFHAFVAFVSFGGSSIYIVLYSYLMYSVPKAKMYKGPVFNKYLAYFGFLIGITLIIMLITFQPLAEWILTVLIYTWILLTALQLLKYIQIQGMYFKREQLPDALKLFEDALRILDNLNLSGEPISDTLKENIEFIKKSMEEPQDDEKKESSIA